MIFNGKLWCQFADILYFFLICRIFGDYNVSNDSYPVWTTNKMQIVYSSREEFIVFSTAFEMVTQVITKLNEKQFSQIVDEILPRTLTLFDECYQKWHEKDSKLDLFLRKYSATGMYLRAIHECLSALEKVRKYQEYVDLVLNKLLVQTIYGLNFRGRWYVRAALISQSHLKNTELAIEVCRIGLGDCQVRGGNRLELFNRLLKMVKVEKEDTHFDEFAKKTCPDFYCLNYKENVIYAEYRTIANDSSCKNFFSITLANGESCVMSVENIVINHYLNQGFTKGIHCESSIYHTFLGLFFWETIYSIDFQDSFRYYKQIGPLDLNYESFYEKRKQEIDSRLLQISNFTEDELISDITFAWHTNLGRYSFLIDWEKISLEELIVCIA